MALFCTRYIARFSPCCRGVRKSCTAVTVLLVCLGSAVQSKAVTPESPEVKAVVEKALSFLTANPDERLGARCLVATCFLKNGRAKDHLIVKQALAGCNERLGNIKEEDNYTLGCVLIFLCELDPDQHRALAQKYLDEILRRQMKNGGWSYSGYETGDTSQTQYAVLGLWMAQRNNFQVPQNAVERVTAWLLRTQDVGGGWTYQGNDPGNYQRIKQDPPPTLSLSAAGLGSLYICADLLGIIEAQPVEKKDDALPSVLKEVATKAAAPKRQGISKVIDAGAVRQAMNLGNQWFQQNGGTEPTEWEHYYMYAFERYRSFRELALGRSEREPAWYNDGFERLRRTQAKDGSWEGSDTPMTCAAFSVLFLSRSSRRAIAKIVGDLGEGTLLGGMGLPPNTADIRERDGKVVETPLSGTVDELLRIIEDPSNPELARLAANPDGIKLDSQVTKRSGQINRLRALVSAGEYQSRLVAVRTLGKVREMDNVPLLIYALTDPDVRIVLEADRGLRFISRKFAGVGLPAQPTQQQVRDAQALWKAWFTSIRPDAEFLD